MNSPRILVIEDDPLEAELFRTLLRSKRYEVICAEDGTTGLQKGLTEELQLVIADFHLPGRNGMEIIRELHRARPKIPIILMTADGTVETAIEATKSGAYDYLLKPFDPPRFLTLVAKALKASELMQDPIVISPSRTAHPKTALIGRSRPMQEIYKEIGRVSALPVTVLIRGETGTGKELIARAIFQHSDRNEKPFIAVNCAAIPETLLESELFGTEKGAYTGAHTKRIGRFEQADQGTLFLDEIGETSPNTQSKLLRVLQERSIQRLGGKESIPINVRIIAATNVDLEAAIEKKLFREDLFYRLNVMVIRVPALRERREDIPAMIHYFLTRYAEEFGITSPSIDPSAVDFLSKLPWPGNVRQLENVIRKALLEARNFTIQVDHVRPLSQVDAPVPTISSPPETPTEGSSLKTLIQTTLDQTATEVLGDAYDAAIRQVEHELFTQILQRTGGNQARAARWLGLSRLTLRTKLQQHQLHPTPPPKPVKSTLKK